MSALTLGSQRLLDVLIRAGLIAALVILCYQVFHPFLNLILWSMILATTLYPLHRMLRPKFGNRDGRTATVIVVVAIAILMVPVYLLGVSMAQSAQDAIQTVKTGSFHIPPPAPSIQDWPLVGDRVYAFWSQLATDVPGFAKQMAPHVKGTVLPALGKLAGIGVDLLLFFFALAIGGIFMAYGEVGERSAVRITERVVGQGKGAEIVALCTAAIRAVAQGVIGIALIQALLVGIGFALMGVPAAGLLSLAVLLLGIMQVPALLVTIPVIIYVFATEGFTVATIIFGIYVFIAGLMDNVLKPLLLGRGVAVPMPVVLIGALGGMVTSGLIGLFIGPVVLAVGYVLFWEWVDDMPRETPTADTVDGRVLQSDIGVPSPVGIDPHAPPPAAPR